MPPRNAGSGRAVTDLPYSQLAAAWLVCSLGFTALWWHQRRTANANAVDVGWAIAIGTLAAMYALLGTASVPMRALVGVLPALWAMRLARHIHQRSGHAVEDSRYRYLRAHWSERTQAKFFVFYQFQSLAAVLFSLPFFALANQPGSLQPGQWLPAMAVWVIAVTGETIADRQLAAWRGQPAKAGLTCRAGLWRYSRHPNYFFEWLHWCSYVPLGLGTAAWWVPLATQALMLLTLLHGTGIPHAERQAVLKRGDDYRHYQATTNAFFPWFPSSRPR